MTKAEARAVKIVDLQEELTEAKRIIGEFVWPGDSTLEQRQAFVQRSAQFAGVMVPVYKCDDERPNNQPETKHATDK